MKASKTILIIGGSGFIGTHLALRLREHFKVFATYHRHWIKIPGVTFLPLHGEDRNLVKRIVYTTRPDVIIYSAGNNNRGFADKYTRLAEMIHTGGPANISGATDILQPRFIYLSNGYVFDGGKGNYHETDTVLPGCMLGKMKLSGENIVKSKYLNYLILRTSPLFGRGNGTNLSFLDKLRMNLDRNTRLEIPNRELHGYAPVTGFCDLVVRLIDSGIRNRVLHYGGLTKVTTFEFAKAFAKYFGYNENLVNEQKFQVKDATYTDDTIYDFSLNSTQATETLKIKPLLLEEGFDLIQQQLVSAL